MDSNLSDIFDDENVISAIIATSKGWIESINKLVDQQRILMDDVLFDPTMKPNKEQVKNYALVTKSKSFVRTNKTLNALAKSPNELVFKKFNSFDIYHNVY